MIEQSLKTLKELIPIENKKSYASLMEQTFYAFIGALTLDSNLNNTTY
jgi:hypothetical protein